MGKSFHTVRELLYWEYAKLIAGSSIGDRKNFAFVQGTFNRLSEGKIHPSTILRENKLFFASGNSCAYCGSEENLQWEHIIPKSKGGPDTIDNQVLGCQKCNLSKGAKDPYQWYGKGKSDQIPRLVLGKMLKLYFNAFEEMGVIDDQEFFSSNSITRRNLCEFFASKKNHFDSKTVF